MSRVSGTASYRLASVAEALEGIEIYEKFILRFQEAMMAFGYPSHRIMTQIQEIAKVCGMRVGITMHPGIALLSFGRWGEPRLVKVDDGGIQLTRIGNVHDVYHDVVEDQMFPSRGTRLLRRLLYASPLYSDNFAKTLSFVTSALIAGIAFGGSLNDMWISGVFGIIVRFLQADSTSANLSGLGNEVFLAAAVSFISRAISSIKSQIFCYSAVSSSSVISMLPGYMICESPNRLCFIMAAD